MALIFGDRVKETTTTTGTGSISLLGAIAGYKTFASVMSIGDTCYYSITSDTSTSWEIGLGTYSALNTLARTTVLGSSTGLKLDLEVGTKNVFITLPKKHIDDLTVLVTTIDGGNATSF